MLKVDLDLFESDTVIEILSNQDNLNFMKENNIVINDIDFTQDFSGLIKKEEVIFYSKNNEGLRMQGSYDLATHTILENDYKKSKNCRTFMKHSNDGDIRFKFYKRVV